LWNRIYLHVTLRHSLVPGREKEKKEGMLRICRSLKGKKEQKEQRAGNWQKRRKAEKAGQLKGWKLRGMRL
jgi:hypothetical protein